ncbi:MAG: DNA polymerase IV, partial [Chloroflexi bacterium]|nr:DNA polymerase IV [Chloroflexota bacterium]
MERAARIARHLKFDVKRRTGLTLSVGVGASKSVAKIASDLEKPDGLVTVPRGTEAAFLAPLPVRALWGVGPRTESLLTGAGIRTIGDLAQRSAASAERLLGQHGAYLHALARGEDDREVATERERKSIGAETTFARDLADGPELREQLHRIATEVGRRMERSGAFASTVAIKLRYANFHTITRQRSVQSPIAGTAEIEDIAKGLLEAVLTPDARVRLIGVQCSRLAIPESTQPPLWSPDDDTDIVPGG